MREQDGMEYFSRGCYTLEEHKLFMCNKEGSQSEDHQERRARGLQKGVRYSVECCQADFCNDGPYPVLQDYSIGKIFLSIDNWIKKLDEQDNCLLHAIFVSVLVICARC